ncbi:propionate catabolism operon regulatory protein PrpR [Limnobacter humi]|uniref:Propionate catabolism operon regulatory protein PrpR n=1 Tax=Limnobacter humi TaxID=1778671 RepID=A0ABT1WIL6_9BURK|nr:propionate catabolism operon regulatory protein PrpR [Limnobacter humi]MCQ8897254.1 propionate catabolism operon regulatory protein PrpR [Limnobacter humi]
MKPRIVVFSISALAGTLREISRDYLHQANIELVSKAYEDALAYARNRYYTDTADVFVAAGSNGAFLANQLEAPLVVIRTDGFDLMQALAVARRTSPEIGLVTYETAFDELAQFSRAFNLSIPTRTYRTPEDARQSVRELAQLGVKTVVGPGLVNEIAQEWQLNSVLIYSRQGVMKAFDEAIRLASAKAGGSPRAARPSYVHHTEQDILGVSHAVEQLRATIRLCGTVDFAVLIQGETGVGKELVAQSIHAASARAGKPFVAINCASLTETLLESELFGYEEGAFSGAIKGGRAGMFESAQGGTVFLDEIGDMPLAFQTRLLRVLEEGHVRRIGSSIARKVDFRLLAASHVNLQRAVQQGRFREDLYYRLNELLIQIPPLRDRPEDIEPLAGHFLRATPVRVPKVRFDDFLLLAMPDLQSLPWPGNIRQLKNVCKRAAIMLAQDLSVSHWKSWFSDLFQEMPSSSRAEPAMASQLLQHTPVVSDWDHLSLIYQKATKAEKPAVVAQALTMAGGQVHTVAKHLGISRSTVWRMAKGLVTMEGEN